MLDLLAASGNIATDLLERTSSSLRVQEIVRLSLAPAFLLAAIGAIMNVMMMRLIWVAERIERLEMRMAEERTPRDQQELARLRLRRKLAQRAVMFSTCAALTICVVVALLFVSAFIEPQLGTLSALAWIATMGLLITGLMQFVAETLVAARGHDVADKRRFDIANDSDG
jgi:sterol desaturase/sphingolipid hydroxylase (fatty acid hydroxylase superfamily)